MTRWFVIGNGPSLNDTPLDELIGENTIAMNRIHLLYDDVEWRPSVYLKVDYNAHLKDVWKEGVQAQLDLGIDCYLLENLKDGYPENHPNYEDMPSGIGDHPNAIWVPRCEHHYHRYGNRKSADSWHLPEICTAFSSISAAMQIAVLRGASEIYLLGCDLGYEKDNPHFTEDYLPESASRAEFTEQSNQNALSAHKVAKKSCPVPVYNATVGGDLEMYPRVNIFELLEEQCLTK